MSHAIEAAKAGAPRFDGTLESANRRWPNQHRQRTVCKYFSTGRWAVREDGAWLAEFESESNAREFAAVPDLLEALNVTIAPLIRLGEFIGNDDNGGMTGLGPFDRCAIISQVRAAIAKVRV